MPLKALASPSSSSPVSMRMRWPMLPGPMERTQPDRRSTVRVTVRASSSAVPSATSMAVAVSAAMCHHAARCSAR